MLDPQAATSTPTDIRKIIPMNMNSLFKRCAAVVAGFTLAACASTQPNRYANIQSSRMLTPNVADDTGRIPYQMTRDTDWSAYTSVYVEPVVIYSGADNQFEELTLPEQQELAEYMRIQFTKELKKNFRIAHDPQPNALRLRLTLTGAKTNTTFVSTFTRFDLGGGPYNVVQGLRGKEGAFMGSVMYAVEVYDASTNELLNAYVAKQYPNAMNVSATVGRLEAAKTGLQKGAEELATRLH